MAMENGNGSAPVPLPGDEPVPETVVDCSFTELLSLYGI